MHNLYPCTNPLTTATHFHPCTGNCGNNIGDKIRNSRGAIKGLLRHSGDRDMPICIGLWVVLGTPRMDSPQ